MDRGALSDLRGQFEQLAQPPFDLQAVCIVAANEELRQRRAAIQKGDNLAGSQQFGTSDGRVVEIVLSGIPGDGMRFAPLAEQAEECVGRGEPWLWTVFTLAWEGEPGSPLWAGRFQAGRLLAASAFPYYESVLPVNVAKASVEAIDVLVSAPVESPRPPVMEIVWHGDRRELEIDSRPVKQFRQRAPSQTAVLAAFQEEDWPERIDTPVREDQLGDAVSRLNKWSKAHGLEFSRDGTGKGIILKKLR